MDDHAAMFRILATVINRSMGGEANMNDVWPLHNDPKTETIKPWSEEELREITERAQRQFNQIIAKHNGRN